MRLIVGGADFSSAGRRPSGSMMIYLAVVDLVDGLLKLAEGRDSRFRFVGPDSSFSLGFQRRRDVVEIVAGSEVVASASISEVLDALTAGTTAFLNDPGNALAGDEPVSEDLATVLLRLQDVASSWRQ
ncbi:hypothetical protein ACWCHM_07135 [Micromonospora sp. SCSIO 07396]